MKRLSRALPADRALRRRHRLRPIAIVLATVLIAAPTAALPLAGAHAQAPDAQAPDAHAPNAHAPNAAQNPASRYPDMRAQWTRLGSAQWDPGKPGGRSVCLMKIGGLPLAPKASSSTFPAPSVRRSAA